MSKEAQPPHPTLVPTPLQPSNSDYNFVTFLCNKPLNVVCSTVDKTPAGIQRGKACLAGIDSPVYRKTIWDIASENGFPCENVGLMGRLDVDTSGICLFTNDSKLANAVRNPPEEGSALSNSVFKTKEYELTLLSKMPFEEKEPFDVSKFEYEFSQPLSFSMKNVCHHCEKPSDVKVIKRFRDISLSRGRDNLGWVIVLRIVLREGKHHQIRRLAHRTGYHIVSLHRIMISSILCVDSIPEPGQCRFVTTAELTELYEGLLLA